MAPRVNRSVTRPTRFLAYGLAGLAGELIFTAAKGRLLRRILGSVPWDHSHARWHIDGLVRADYLSVWAAAACVHSTIRRHKGSFRFEF